MNDHHLLWNRTRALAVSLMMVAALLLPVAAASQTAATPPAVDRLDNSTILLPPGADVILERPQGDKGAYPKLDPQLAQLYASAAQISSRPLDTFAGQGHIDLATGTARVIIEMDVDPQARLAGPPTIETVTLSDGRTATIEHAAPTAIRADLAAAITATGATFELGVGDLVQVLAPFGSLEALSQIAGVRIVRLPFPAQEQAVTPPQMPDVGTQTTEGVALTNADDWHAAPYSYDGTGVSLAVFDFGFTGWDTRQTNGDLPSGASLVRHDFSGGAGGYSFGPPGSSGYEHGTACAEIAYDMAPGSTVHLYAWGTDAEFANAVNDYRNNVSGRRVATMSIGWVNAGPYDGTGSTTGPTTQVNNAQASGIFWANSAGNYQTQHHSGTSTQYGTGDGVAFGTGNIEGIGPTPGSVWAIPSGTVLRFYLEWNDWNAGRTGDLSNIDYDMELYRWTGSAWTYITGSQRNQCTANNTPVEAIAYTVPANGPYYYGLTIWRDQTGCTNNFGHWLDLYTYNGFYSAGTGLVDSFWYSNHCNSLSIPADADGAVAVGATFWNEDTNPTYNYGLETFSSCGPRNASGGANPGTTVNKPDTTAPDGVSTAAYGASNGQPYRTSTSTGFFGTSGAAPHVAGLAATVWEKYPTMTLANLRTYVTNAAVDKGGGGGCGEVSGQNNRFGYGRVNLPSPTYVRLARFQAWPERAAIHVEWETVTEIDNLGFNLYRADAPEGLYARLNRELIPSQAPGSPSGAIYVWLDSTVQTGRTYYYKLEDVDVYGHNTLHGPVRVKVGPVLRTKP
jgi:hypothetical protein